MIWADERRVPISGPKSMVSFIAGLRASGKASAAVIVPARMSTLRKSSNAISAIERTLQNFQRRLRTLGQVIKIEDHLAGEAVLDDGAQHGIERVEIDVHIHHQDGLFVH